MSLYNMMFGHNPAAPLLLTMLGLDLDQIPRFRDCQLEGNRIMLLTRTGGGNRPDYEEQNQFLRTIPGFIEDQDWDFDTTYAKWYYTFPEKYKPFIDKIPQGQDLSEKWNHLFRALGDPNSAESAKAKETFEPLFKQIQDKLNG